MRVLVSGSSGLVGTALKSVFGRRGDEVCSLVRKRSAGDKNTAYWNPDSGEIDLSPLSSLDVVVHLAGENIAEGRWTEDKKKRIRDSRVQATNLLCSELAKLDPKPRVLISASAIGIYGDRGSEVLTETSSPGSDFLAQVCAEWESATAPAKAAGIRVVNIRIGIVISKDGGALAKLLTPFKLGVGGKVGSGQQFMSWIALDDLVKAIVFLIETETASGPVNLVAPGCVTNSEFTATLGHVLKRPTIIPAPAFAMRLAFGEMADALLLSSARVEPTKLKSLGFEFDYPTLTAALSHELDQ